MTTIRSQEVKRQLAQLLKRASDGEEFLITRNGIPVARLSPPQAPKPEVKETIRKLRELRKGNVLGNDLSIRDLIEDGRQS